MPPNLRPDGGRATLSVCGTASHVLHPNLILVQNFFEELRSHARRHRHRRDARSIRRSGHL